MNSTIKINHIPPQTVCLYHECDGLVGVDLNEHELNDIRIQIKEGKLEGFFVMFGGEKITINSMGQLSNWPDGFFDLLIKQLMQL